MSKNTSITLGPHFEAFIAARIKSGRFGNASEVMRAGLRLLEESERRDEALRQALLKGEQSGLFGPLDMDAIKAEARKAAGLDA